MRYLLGDYTTEGGPGLVAAGPGGLGRAAAAADPSWIVTGGPGGVVYSVAETDQGTAEAWRVGEDFTPVPVGQARPVGGAAPCHAAIHPSGRWLLVANYGSGSVAVLPIGSDGALGEATDVHQLVGSGPDPERQEGPHAHQVVFRDGRVLVVDLGSDAIHAFDLDGGGRLQPVAATALEPGFGPRHLVFLGKRAFVVGELANAVQVATFDPGSAQFDLGPVLALPGTDQADLAALPDIGLPEGVPRPQPAAIVADPDHNLIYVTIRGTDQLAVIDPSGPALLRSVPVGGSWPRDAVLTADGTVLVACQFSGTVTRVDPTGRAAAETVWDCPGVSRVAPLA